MKCIRRRKPPPGPVGINRCDQDTRTRWESENFMYPPYQFKEQYLIYDERISRGRLLNSRERERLMGFGDGHTLPAFSASKAKQDKQGYEDERCSLLGDSFAIPSFSIIAAFAIHKWVPFLAAEQVTQRLGLPPGFKLHSRFSWPLGEGGALY